MNVYRNNICNKWLDTEHYYNISPIQNINLLMLWNILQIYFWQSVFTIYFEVGFICNIVFQRTNSYTVNVRTYLLRSIKHIGQT